MKIKTYKLKFTGGLHVYESGYGMEAAGTIIHSDTLFSSIVNAASKLYNVNIVNEFISEGKIKISSAYPFMGNEYYLPKPLNWKIKLINYNDIKAFKKIKFVNKELFERILNNDTTDFIFNKEDVIDGCITRNSQKPGSISQIQESTRIIMDRIDNSTTMFNFFEVHFSKGAGLYFFADIHKSIEKEFRAAIRFLGDEGIGGDRTVGKGMFELEEDENFNLDCSSVITGKYVLLSLYNPTKDEVSRLKSDISKYDLITRQGWISYPGYTDVRRKSLRLFKEGSVLCFDSIKPQGRLADVYEINSNVTIKRNGVAFAIGINTGVT